MLVDILDVSLDIFVIIGFAIVSAIVIAYIVRKVFDSLFGRY